MNSVCIIFFFLYFFQSSRLMTSYLDEYEDPNLWHAAHKEIAREAKEYFKENESSNTKNLLSFIAKLRQKYKKRRRKRQEFNNNKYIIKKDNAENSKSFILTDNSPDNPLVISIPLESSFKSETNDIQSCIDKKLDKYKASNIKRSIYKDQKQTENNKLESISQITALSKILENFQDLINIEVGKRPKESLQCAIYGDWDSKMAGKTFHVTHNRKSNSYAIKMNDLEPKPDEGFMLGTKWNVTVHVPFQHASEIIIISYANENKKIALFLGECRRCDGSETITGNWIVGKTSSGCKDQKSSHDFFADVLTKNNFETLRKHNLKKLTKT